MNRSSRNPDAYDQIRDDALTEQKPNLHNKMMNYQNKIEDALARPNKGEAYLTAVQFAAEIDARIASLEAQLADATERERVARQLLIDAHEPDQGQQRTEWDERVDAWLAASEKGRV